MFETLIPPPRSIEPGDTSFRLPDPPTYRWRGASDSAGMTLERIDAELRRAGRPPMARAEGDAPRADVLLRLDPSARTGPEGYRLRIDAQGIELLAEDAPGLFYAAATLAQMLRARRFEHPGEPLVLPGVRIEDRPDFPHRGVMLDVSRDKVPTLAALDELVDRLAGWKINQLQLYTEHTFAYRGHALVWGDASPLTAADIVKLDAFCKARHIELVPNQNSFGHFHRWLVHPPYRHLAETPEGIEHPFSFEPEPFSLCPIDPRSIALLAELYDQLLPNFASKLFNVGLDETFELGQGRSAHACAERGKARVYLDFLRRVHGLVSERGRRMMLWGDIILEHPELIPELPDDVVVLEWGYEAEHPFDSHGARYAAAGRDFYVCPGTSSWNSFAGRAANALANLASAARHGHAHGASGYLITDWGDHGHLQTPPISELGFLAGAAFSWNTSAADWPTERRDAAIDRWLDLHAFADRAGVLGRLVHRLGDTYLVPGPPPQNGSALFFLLVFAGLERERPRVEGVSVEGLEQTLAHVEETLSQLPAALSERRDADLLHRELTWTGDLLTFAARFGLARLRGGELAAPSALSSAVRRELAGELGGLVERHRKIVLGRHRPGGLERSSWRLRRVVEVLGAG